MTQFTEAPIFDADQHMYETPDALTKYLPEQYRSKVQFIQIGRHTRIAILNKITDYMPNPTFERVAAPGAHEKFYSGQNPEGLSMREMSGRGIEAPAGSRNPEDRIAEMDRQGVEACLNFPTLANLVEHSAAEDPDLTAAIIHALNQWMLDTGASPTPTGSTRRRCSPWGLSTTRAANWSTSWRTGPRSR